MPLPTGGLPRVCRKNGGHHPAEAPHLSTPSAGAAGRLLDWLLSSTNQQLIDARGHMSLECRSCLFANDICAIPAQAPAPPPRQSSVSAAAAWTAPPLQAAGPALAPAPGRLQGSPLRPCSPAVVRVARMLGSWLRVSGLSQLSEWFPEAVWSAPAAPPVCRLLFLFSLFIFFEK